MDPHDSHPIDPELAAAVRDLADPPGDPASEPGERLAYLLGELDDEAREDFEDRMAWDGETAASVRRLEQFEDDSAHDALMANVERTTEDEAADWRAIQARLDSATAARAPSAEVSQQRRPPRGSARSLRPWRFAVAALLLTVVGLGLQVSRLERRVGELEGPRTDLGIVTLRPGNAATREGTPTPGATLDPGGRLVVVLSYTGFEPFEHHGVVLTQDSGGVLWSDLDLDRNPNGSFLLELPGDWLAEHGDPEQPFTIQLMGISGEQQTPLAQYPLRIDRASRGQATPQH